MKKIEMTLHVSTLVAAISFVLACVFTIKGIETMVIAKLRQAAIGECMSAYSYTFEDGKGGTIREPITEKVAECMRFRGY